MPLTVASPWAWVAASREWRIFYLAALALLVFALTVVVSPNIFDNGKLTMEVARSFDYGKNKTVIEAEAK